MGHDQTLSELSNQLQAGNTGFAELAPVAAAWGWLDALPARAGAETLPLEAAYGRVLARDMTVDAAAPGTPRAAANGYAVRAAECVGASAYNPLRLALLPLGTDALPEAAACPIATGWALPTGADAVLPLDAAQADGPRWLEVLDAVPRGAGIDTPPPTLCLRAGRRLRPQDLGCLAAAGTGRVGVLPRPRVALLVRGAKSGPDMLSPMLHALLARDGAAPTIVPLAATDPAALLAALTGPAVAACDLVVLAGRAGVGIDDTAAAAVSAAGGTMALHGLALRPGGNAGLATLPIGGGALPGSGDAVPVLLLPGEPLACLAAYDLLGARLVRRLAGLAPPLPYPVAEFPLARKIVSGLGSMDLVPVRLADGHAEPVADAGLAGAARADGFVLVSEGSEGYPAGARVPVHLYDPTMQGGMA
ncbi:MAG TPA: molybdopterin-binding protein [Acetobacteraceae bacterium]